VLAILQSVGITIAGAFLAAGWHVLARNGQPESEDLAVGFDVLVAAMTIQLTFIRFSHGLVADVRWWGFVLLFVIIMAMAVATRMHGYGPVIVYSRPGEDDLPLYRMTTQAALVTSALGCAALCSFWWLNVNIDLVIRTWKELLH
jgi:hypothetical protein